MTKWSVRFDFNGEGDPPEVYIVDKSGMAYLEVFEEPKCVNGEFSWEPEDWEYGDLTGKVLARMNSL